ncbi:unnamed protein product, partial [Mesorhabditis belari]|uniref:C2H2-type domain-containing protein n=1 Tax=Mesorhabditis belari TaxID=2138241 RepID=A0AAF3EAQ7_9BILA
MDPNRRKSEKSSKCELCLETVRIKVEGKVTSEMMSHAAVHLQVTQFCCSKCKYGYYTKESAMLHVHQRQSYIFDTINDNLLMGQYKMALACFPESREEIAEWFNREYSALKKKTFTNRRICQVPTKKDVANNGPPILNLPMDSSIGPLVTNQLLKSEVESQEPCLPQGGSKQGSSGYREDLHEDYMHTVKLTIEVQRLQEELKKKENIIFDRDGQIADLRLKLKSANNALEEKDKELKELKEMFQKVNESRDHVRRLLGQCTEELEMEKPKNK